MPYIRYSIRYSVCDGDRKYLYTACDIESFGHWQPNFRTVSFFRTENIHGETERERQTFLCLFIWQIFRSINERNSDTFGQNTWNITFPFSLCIVFDPIKEMQLFEFRRLLQNWHNFYTIYCLFLSIQKMRNDNKSISYWFQTFSGLKSICLFKIYLKSLKIDLRN